MKGCRKCLEEMKRNGFKPNRETIGTYQALIGLFARGGDMRTVKALFGEVMAHGTTADLATYNMMLEVAAKQKEHEFCERLYSGMCSLFISLLGEEGEREWGFEYIKQGANNAGILLSTVLLKVTIFCVSL